MTGVAATMIAGWTLTRDSFGIYLGGIIGAVLVVNAFYPENRGKSGKTDGSIQS